ncbi:MAG TPA: TonB-dependent receptor [Ohtaekwangia sp.]|nr:TonB-dependent receptor [Ohtaekwangia sp.]
MRTNIFFIFFLIIACSSAYAQQSFTLSGKVVDENNAAVPFANAALYNSTDSTLVTGAVSDDGGGFSIQTKEGRYYLMVTFLSYEEAIVPNINLNRDIQLQPVVLKASSQILESIVVEGEKSQMELYLDKRVFQVGKDLSNISGSASDILDNVPSVTVDVEGNVSLRGSQNVRILIDGKPSGLAGISTADALQQLQGNLIESVEVITNPSARYDAEGEVGIINIILKKEERQGVNGSFSANAGHPDNFGASASVNFRRNRFNFFTSYGFNYRSGPGSGKSFQSFDLANPDTSFTYRQENDRVRSNRSHNLRAGMDYFFDDRNILTGAFLIRRSSGLNKTENRYYDYDAEGNQVGFSIRDEREEEPEINSEVSLSYRREYKKKGQLFTADFKWIENVETEDATFRQEDFFADDVTFQRSSNTENERNALAQVDYVHPFGQKGRWEAGLKSTLRVIDNDFTVEERDQESGEYGVIGELDNNLIYTENIHAGYFIIGNEINRFSWQAGLRGELSDISVELVETNDINYQNYFNVFPSAHLSYRFAPEKTIQLSYSYRLSRPRFRDLMPFSNYSDNRSLNVGNPNLRPEYTNSIEAGYLLNWESGSLLSSVYYRYRTGVVENIPQIDSAGFTRRMPVNLSTQDAYGLEVNLSWNPVRVWRLNANANFYRAITEGMYNDERYFADTYTWTSRVTSRITFLKKWDFQTGFNYRAPRETPQGRNKSMYHMDLGLSRDLMKGNATITASVRDVFNTRRFRGITERISPEEVYYSENDSQWRVRQFLLTFTYRLNMKKEQRRGENSENNNGDGDFDPMGEY